MRCRRQALSTKRRAGVTIRSGGSSCSASLGCSCLRDLCVRARRLFVGPSRAAARQLQHRPAGRALRRWLPGGSALLHVHVRERPDRRAPAGPRAQRRPLRRRRRPDHRPLRRPTATACPTPASDAVFAHRARPATTASRSPRRTSTRRRRRTVYRWPYAAGDRVATGPMEIRRQRNTERRPRDAHAGRRRAEPPLRQHRQRQQRGRSRDPATPPATRALIRRYDLASIPAGGYPAATARCSPTACATRSASRIDSKGRMWGVENGRDNLMRRRRHPLRQPRRRGEPVRRQPPRPQLRLSVLLERRDLDGHGDGEGRRDAAPGSRSARRVHRGEVPGRERGRPARVRAAARTWRRWTSSSTRGGGYPADDAGQSVRHVARIVEPRDRPGRPR